MDLIRRGANALRAWRAAHPEDRLELAGADLRGETLDGLDLAGAVLDGADLSDAVLRRCVLSRTSADGLLLVNARLTECEAVATTWSTVTGTALMLERCQLDQSRIWQLDAQGAQLLQCSFNNANLGAARLDASEVRDCEFSNANMAGLSARSAHWSQTTVRDCDVSTSELRECKLEYVEFENANLFSSRLDRAELRDCEFTGGSLESVSLVQAELARCKLRRVALDLANFSDSRWKGGQFEDVQVGTMTLHAARMHGVEISNCEFARTTLTSAGLRRCMLENVRFKSCDLEMASLRRSRLTNCHLSEEGPDEPRTIARRTDLRGARLTDCRFGSAAFSQAVVSTSTMIWDCVVNRHTDFRGVPLRSTRVQGLTIALLERNGRRLTLAERFADRRAMRLVYRSFWGLSDFGSSTRRLLLWFAGFALGFALLYLIPVLSNSLLGTSLSPFIKDLQPGSAELPLVIVRSVYFSIVTMTTLGFGDMCAEPSSYVGHFLLAMQVCLGYLILAALVTRLAIAFQEAG